MVLREQDDQVVIEWNDPAYLAWRHGLEECELPLGKVAGALSDIAAEAAGD